MKVVVANRFYFPDESATSRMVTSLASGLASRGHVVHVVTSRRLHDRPGRLAAREIVAGINIHRVWTTQFGRARLLGRIFDYVTFHLATWWYVIGLAKRRDVVVACTDPPLLSVTLMLATLGSRAGLVNWLHDLFPEAAGRLELLDEKSLSFRLLRTLRDMSLRRARRNVAPIPRMAAHLITRGVPAGSFEVIRNWSDGALICPVESKGNPLRREWGLEDKFVVGYSGNFGRVHEFGTILDAAESLADERNVIFLFIGDGQRRAWVEAEVRRRGLANVLFKPLQPRHLLSESLGAADVHLVSLLPHLEMCSVPSKFYGILASGRPTLFVGDPEGEIAVAIADAGCGVAVRVGDGAGLAEHIRWLYRSKEHREMGVRARQAFERSYHEDAGVCAWHRLLCDLDPFGRSTLAGPVETAVGVRR